jgi:hypothetical protein
MEIYNIRVGKLINNFFDLLNEGLFQKYYRDAGPVQTINITYEKKRDICILQKQKRGNAIEIDIIGNFIEEKLILADLSNPLFIRTRLENIQGTLFVKYNIVQDLILEF